MNIPEKWCENVSRAIGSTPQNVRRDVTQWINRGQSLDYIKRVLILTALAHGKKLIFISKKGASN